MAAYNVNKKTIAILFCFSRTKSKVSLYIKTCEPKKLTFFLLYQKHPHNRDINHTCNHVLLPWRGMLLFGLAITQISYIQLHISAATRQQKKLIGAAIKISLEIIHRRTPCMTI